MVLNSKKTATLINDVVNLVKANNKANQHEEDIIDLSEPGIAEKLLKQTPEEIALISYFDNLSYEDIQLLQAIMYIGRDGKSYYFDKKDKVTSSELLQTAIDYHSGLHSGDKDAAVSHIIGKAPLDRYLTDGAEILNISLNI